ncbi:MAG: UpxY family transcription antiterminator [Gemmatimonadetes bacterium]|nr:UpxY family transcription antiterminator [Gemmatimonadota bacterium]
MKDTQPPIAPWRAVYTRARHEKKVATALSDRRFDVYLPLVARESQWHDRRKLVEWPMFSGYVFVRLGVSESAVVLGVPGVVSLVGIGGSVAELPDLDIENVRALEAAIAATGVVPQPEPLLEEGERVRVRTGPFTGIEGVIIEHRGDRAVLQVGLSSIRQAVRLDVAAADVVVLESVADR